MFAGTAQVSHQVCQIFCQFCWVPWDDAIVVSAGKLRKLWDSLSELPISLCERRLERTVLSPALLPVKTAQCTQFFRQVWRHTVKSLFSWECVGRFIRHCWCGMSFAKFLLPPPLPIEAYFAKLSLSRALTPLSTVLTDSFHLSVTQHVTASPSDNRKECVWR
jgi:hypothetical protein